ncbi:meiotic recombination protein REC114 isoform X2 [Rhineura floridana]|uniref:meiotic recombination protein REC114 isoform X2 n=1 Tax=Rhineura floridana TaxID=261503 RepID=UPI002AC7FF12|nr:meiotic recombination protein REC114 isoform X2 [Rhineura floridana]
MRVCGFLSSDCSQEMMTGSSNSLLWLNCDPALCSEAEQPLPGQIPETEQSRDASSCLSAAEWPLRRYGKFMPGSLGNTSGSWEVLESNKESGFLVLTIVISGHFFISRGKEVLEGFSLIDASQWLKIVRNADCMLFGSKAKLDQPATNLLRIQSKNKHRMFRVQFMGDSKTLAEEHCNNCVQKLADYVPVQVMDAARQELEQGHSLLLDTESQPKDAEQNVPMQHTVVNLPPAQERTSVAELAQHVLTSKVELPLAYQQSQWNAEDLGSFIRLCLMDQSFPAFVQEVEKQLKKITDG